MEAMRKQRRTHPRLGQQHARLLLHGGVEGAEETLLGSTP